MPTLTKQRYLSAAEREAFERDGFLLVPRLFGPEEIRRISGGIDDLAAGKPRKDEWLVHYEDSLLKKGEKLLSRVENFTDFHEGLRSFIYDPRICDRAEEILGEPAVLFKEKINFKMPGGAGFKPHQDIQPAGWDAYAEYFISVLIAVDPSTLENGCMELVARRHKEGWLGKRGQFLTPEEIAGMKFEKYPMAPGDALFFDCFVPHQSGPNFTDRPRRNLYLTFNRRSEGDQRKRYFSAWRKDLTLRKLFPWMRRRPSMRLEDR